MTNLEQVKLGLATVGDMVQELERRGVGVAVVVSRNLSDLSQPGRPYSLTDEQVYADTFCSQHPTFKAALLSQGIEECITETYEAEGADRRTRELCEELSDRLRAVHRDLEKLLPDAMRNR
jgi:hypothetical protein